ncbi:hypothetical protein HK105_205424 [Polyrhizophydium stewartii]|uniref:Uncharacterized protein n=1 Tax=Polyrhizophydium stewartii TaxID=2732419 RepID=A0ABR4N6G2_9FUNG
MSGDHPASGAAATRSDTAFKESDDLGLSSRRTDPLRMQLAQMPDLRPSTKRLGSQASVSAKVSFASIDRLAQPEQAQKQPGTTDRPTDAPNPKEPTPEAAAPAAQPAIASRSPSHHHLAADTNPLPSHHAPSAPPSIGVNQPAGWIHSLPSSLHAAPSFDLDRLTTDDAREHRDRLEIMIAENDHLVEQNRQSAREIDSLRDQVERYGRTLGVQVAELEAAKDRVRSLEHEISVLNDAKDALEREVKIGNNDAAHSRADVEALQNQIRHRNRELDACHAKIAELKKALSEITERYQLHIKEAAANAEREKELIDELRAKSASLDGECQSRVCATQSAKEVADLRQQNETLLQVNRELEKRIAALERKEIASMEESQRCAHELDEARFERDKAIERETRARDEVAHLAAKLAEMPAKYAEKNEAAIETLRSQFNQDRRKFADETSKLEVLCATLQNQAERAIREKRAAESELEKLTRHIPAETDRLTMMIEELHSKLRASERERADAMHKVESVHQKLAREQNAFETERAQSGTRVEEAYRRLRKVERELEETKQERISMHTRISALEHERKTLLEQRTKKQLQHEAEVASLTERSQSQVSELESKLEHVTEAHSKICRDMQQLLADQRRLGEKWKDESARMTEHYESALAHSRAQIAQFQTKVNDLEAQLQKASARHRDLMEQIAHEKREQSGMHARCLNAESRIESLGRQVGLLVGKEAEMIEERKRLQREVDRLTMEKERLQKDARSQMKHEIGLNTARLRQVAVVDAVEHNPHAAPVAGGLGDARDLEAEIARLRERLAELAGDISDASEP